MQATGNVAFDQPCAMGLQEAVNAVKWNARYILRLGIILWQRIQRPLGQLSAVQKPADTQAKRIANKARISISSGCVPW